ncbi:MAG: arginyltransferase [Gammaproteobacteria bacterium]|nr:arginyltransferase [Gammaproteobacteria bacterium]
MNNQLDFYLTAEQECNYLDKQSQNVFLDPTVAPSIIEYQKLLELGFRRSGSNVYRPHCSKCNSCLSIRVDVANFSPRTSQKRCLKKNQDIYYQATISKFSQEHFDLYIKYLNSRHLGDGMDDSTEKDYMNFLGCSWGMTEFIEFRLKEDDKLVSVAVTDVVNNALSSVYTFFDIEPEYHKRSLGVFCILSQIEYAKSKNLDWVYLGYWIKENQKMSYKNQYKPAQVLFDNQWLSLDNFM